MAEGRAVEELVVGVLGGTGPQGRGLAVRWAAAGQRVLLGSRDPERAAEVAQTVAERARVAAAGTEVSVQGGSNTDVAGAGPAALETGAADADDATTGTTSADPLPDPVDEQQAEELGHS